MVALAESDRQERRKRRERRERRDRRDYSRFQHQQPLPLPPREKSLRETIEDNLSWASKKVQDNAVPIAGTIAAAVVGRKLKRLVFGKPATAIKRIQQHGPTCLACSLKMVMNHQGIRGPSVKQLHNNVRLSDGSWQSNAKSYIEAKSKATVSARSGGTLDDLARHTRAKRPVLVEVRESPNWGTHAMVVTKVTRTTVYYKDPARRGVLWFNRKMSRGKFNHIWRSAGNNEYMVITKRK